MNIDEIKARIEKYSSLDQLFKDEDVRFWLKSKDLTSIYYCINTNDILKGQFTQALYNSGVNPFDYLELDNVNYAVYMGMFYNVDIDVVTLPVGFTSIDSLMFQRCHIKQLIVLDPDCKLGDVDAFYFGTRIDEIYLGDWMPFLDWQKSCAQYYFDNRKSPLTIHLNEYRYDTEDRNPNDSDFWDIEVEYIQRHLFENIASIKFEVDTFKAI